MFSNKMLTCGFLKMVLKFSECVALRTSSVLYSCSRYRPYCLESKIFFYIVAISTVIVARFFFQVVKEAIAAGVDGYDAEIKKAVRKAAFGLRLTREVAMNIASKAVSIRSWLHFTLLIASEPFVLLNKPRVLLVSITVIPVIITLPFALHMFRSVRSLLVTSKEHEQLVAEQNLQKSSKR